ncbi:Tah11p LALA0_S07e02564g [Lachancea lanzarotensis]|uniref:LALA0S07e02564g1_1 n=1 Tax=Lachancea lanzarotensis TaxID=1245769 RepID=A0A0C7N5A2_9SACH|nr:uncharacterized protein LALA0_S07e02564g [Lachancea lanzarotensis]CEP63108.1 LALA0S07e02564g1_1 [Lachancea lanzarotensis]
MLQVIDLNVVTSEDELSPIIRDCLRYHSAFLLKNYANMDAVQSLLSMLKREETPNTLHGFDRHFTGAENLEGGISVEQYLGQPDRLSLRDSTTGKLTSRLMRISTFFAKVCLESVGGANAASALIGDASNCCVKVTRFYKSTSNSIMDLNFDYEDEYRLHSSAGIITVFPAAQGIKYKVNDGWKVIEEPDCILIQTGSLLSPYPNSSTQNVEAIKFPMSSVMHFTIFPLLHTAFSSETVFDVLLRNQIQEFPHIMSKLYPRESSIDALTAKVEYCKNIFNVTDSVLSLYSISRSLMTSAPELYTLLPQISNMLKRKVSQDDFLRMMSIWDEAYALEFNNSFEITIRPPSAGIMNHLSNKSRKLEYTERADEWFQHAIETAQIPSNVPVLSVKKRRGSDSLGKYQETATNGATAPFDRKLASLKKNRSKGYLFNTKEKFMFKEGISNAGDVSLLERIREKERKAAALLSQRERNYEQFLNVKTYQIFNILFSLPQNKPYTITHLTSLIIDSLSDSNNPIGDNETHQVLSRLQSLLPDRINMIEAEGNLKVYRWVDLDKELLDERMKYLA